MENLPKITLLSAIVIVALSSAILPNITGYGTILYQVVVLGGWMIVAAITSGMFADQNQQFVWPVVAVLNTTLFAIPAAVIFRRFASPKPSVFIALIILWFAFYLCSLFFIFPATDGP